MMLEDQNTPVSATTRGAMGKKTAQMIAWEPSAAHLKELRQKGNEGIASKARKILS